MVNRASEVPIVTCAVCRGSRTLPGFPGGAYVCSHCLLKQVKLLVQMAEANARGRAKEDPDDGPTWVMERRRSGWPA